MKRYRANAKVLGLQPGETFESDDKFYEPFAVGGYLSVVGQDEEIEESTDEDDKKTDKE